MTGDTSPIRRLAGMLSRKASELRTGAKASSQGAVQDPGSIAVVLDDAAKIEPARVINTPGTAAPQPPRLKTGTLLLYVGLAAVLLAPGLLLGSTRDLSAWQRAMLDITFGRGLRFWLGVLGAVLLVLLLLYPVRKLLAHRFRISSVGKWFNLHTIVGILVTLLILYHANFSFSVRDVSASAALFATLVIFVSGIVGHFVYTSASVDYLY